MVKVIWDTKDVVKRISLDKEIQYQRSKFQYLKKPLLDRYLEVSQSKKKEYPFYSSILKFKDAPVKKGFLIALVLEVVEKETHTILRVVDLQSYYTLRIENEFVKTTLLEGTQWGFFVEKTEKKQRVMKSHNILKEVLTEAQEVELHYGINDYLYPGYGEIEWNNTSTAKVVILSDIHVGNMTFCKENFLSLLSRISADPTIKYAILNGDLVDGNQVYPSQNKDLDIDSYVEQYKCLAQYLQLLRKDITIVLAPGNHDYVGKIEPQSFSDYIEEIFKEKLKNVIFGPNPGYYEIDGIYFYLTHGTSYNSILRSIESLDYSRCAEVSEYLLKVRNISPLRSAVPIGPNKNLNHLIPEKVNVLCSGHMHSQQVKVCAPNRLLIATGAWQTLTPYMDLLGLKPNVSTCVVLDLSKFGAYEEWDLKDHTTSTHSYHVALIQKDFKS